MTRSSLQLRHFVPLAGFVIPTVLIGYGVVIPRSCIAGWNELSVGFAATVIGACVDIEKPLDEAGFAEIRSTVHEVGSAHYVVTGARRP